MKNVFGKSGLILGLLLLALAGCATNTGEKTGAYIDDSWITSKMKSEMVADKTVSAHNISVDTSQGVVKLTGTAATTQESDKAVQIARGVKGVKAVENDIRVQ